MNAIIGIVLCIIAILICTAIASFAYNLGVNSQKKINKLINYHDYLKGYEIGYSDGCMSTIIGTYKANKGLNWNTFNRKMI